MLSDVGEQLHLEDEMEAYWEAHQREAPLQRFIGAIREVYLENASASRWSFSSMKSTTSAACRNSKPTSFLPASANATTGARRIPKFLRLTFCLLGVATPSDLIRDQRMTPFNIGRAIELHDFTATKRKCWPTGSARIAKPRTSCSNAS